MAIRSIDKHHLGRETTHNTQFILLYHCLVLESNRLSDKEQECLHTGQQTQKSRQETVILPLARLQQHEEPQWVT
jgi:hypothetical protein